MILNACPYNYKKESRVPVNGRNPAACKDRASMFFQQYCYRKSVDSGNSTCLVQFCVLQARVQLIHSVCAEIIPESRRNIRLAVYCKPVHRVERHDIAS